MFQIFINHNNNKKPAYKQRQLVLEKPLYYDNFQSLSLLISLCAWYFISLLNSNSIENLIAGLHPCHLEPFRTWPLALKKSTNASHLFSCTEGMMRMMQPLLSTSSCSAFITSVLYFWSSNNIFLGCGQPHIIVILYCWHLLHMYQFLVLTETWQPSSCCAVCMQLSCSREAVVWWSSGIVRQSNSHQPFRQF